jgi:hypothetical protein
MSKTIEPLSDEIEEYEAIWTFYFDSGGAITQRLTTRNDIYCHDRVFDSDTPQHSFRDIIVLIDGKKDYYINSSKVKMITRETIDGKEATASQ